MKKVFITRRLPKIAGETLVPFFRVYENPLNEPVTDELLCGGYDGILSTVADKFTREVLEARNRLKVISNYAVGLDNIDVEAADEMGIAVYNTPDVVTDSTADLTIALLLALIRKVPEACEFVRRGRWGAWDPEIFLGEELVNKTFGILGFGRIGQAVARRVAGFGLKVIFCDPFVEGTIQFEELLRESDYISIHVALTPETRGMIDVDAIDKMVKRPILLNMARGPAVDTDALVTALRAGKVRGAALDVTEPEPIPGDHPLCQLENCIITPHIGTATVECRHNMARLAAQNIVEHFRK